ncbi:MAG: ABC transporter ATP-binding protein [Epsilonproteobacteria bacterium]|nr:ABC transporter ATP-binding protein [Campylobacterota bacterium]NPA57204.1 ABC transporter ATP-binding protein [Campylobacterota bacterium]
MLAAIPTPLLMPLLVDELLLQRPGWWTTTLSHLGITSVGGIVMATLLTVLLLRITYTFLQVEQSRLLHRVSKGVTASLRKEVLSHLERVALHEYENLGSGGVASRLIHDVETIDSFLSNSVAKFFISLLMLLGITAVLLLIHWQLALFILLLNPFVVLFSTKLARKVARLKREEQRAVEQFQEALVETLQLFEEIRAVNRESLFFQNLRELVDRLKERSIEFSYRHEAGIKMSFLLFVGGFELFRAAGIVAVAYSDLSIGLMMAIFAYLWFMMTPIQDLITIQYAYRNASVALDRINGLLALEPEPTYPHRVDPFENPPIAIDLRNLSFRYGEKVVLEGITLTVEPLSRTAIVGASGSGKSTLCKLLVGFYPPQEGEIRYNGYPIQEIGLPRVRDRVALLLQYPRLFPTTLRFNLTLGEEIEEERIWRALEMAQIAQRVRELPQGLESKVGREGISLSGGERQRIALARVILREPQVIIFDEATSAIDIETERRIFSEMEEFLQERTTIWVAHRPSTIEKADTIYFLKEGRVAGSLSFDEYKGKFR